MACLTPLALLVWRAWTDDLTANPISFITNWLGDWTFRILLTALVLTPLRIVTGMAWQMSLRRLVGLFAFFYAALHFSVWIVLDHFFDWREMGADIVKRPGRRSGVRASPPAPCGRRSFRGRRVANSIRRSVSRLHR